MSEEIVNIDVRRIMEIMPHRYPFLLVDRITRLVPGQSIEALKNVTINEPFFLGHFPGLPVMPGVLILESLAQSGGVLVYESYKLDMSAKVFLFAGIEKVRFRKPVVPGDQLRITLHDMKRKFNIFRMHGEARVDGEIVVEASMTAAMVDREGIA